MPADRPPYSAKVRTPFAVLGIRVADGVLASLELLPQATPVQAPADAATAHVVAEIERYLEDPRHRIELPLAPAPTEFQQRMREAMLGIPAGRTRTYGDIAKALGTAPRAVGRACGANPIALVVPCHRVVGSDGGLGGFMQAAEGMTLEIKRWLLAHEAKRPSDPAA